MAKLYEKKLKEKYAQAESTLGGMRKAADFLGNLGGSGQEGGKRQQPKQDLHYTPDQQSVSYMSHTLDMTNSAAYRDRSRY